MYKLQTKEEETIKGFIYWKYVFLYVVDNDRNRYFLIYSPYNLAKN